MSAASLIDAVTDRLYAAALALLPRAVRERYRDDMRATFDARRRHVAVRGTTAVVVLVARELVDLVHASVAARGRQRPPLLSPRPLPQRRDVVRSLTQDLRYALRMLRRQPGFNAVAVLTLALGIGATTAVFTVVNGVLLRPLPYREPDRLVQLFHGRDGRLSRTFSPPNYRDVTTGSGVFSAATAVTPSSANITGVGDPQLVDGASVTTSFFTVLGVVPRYGRGLVESDGADGGAAVVVIGDNLWRRLLGARPDVVGMTLRMDGKPFTIVGVAPPELRIPGGAEYWRPLVFKPRDVSDEARGAQWIGAIARLKPDVDLARAKSAMAVMANRLAREFPKTNKDRVMTAMRLQDRIVGGIRPALLILLGSVTLVLLVACVNVANLLLARAGGRWREVAVRAAVGAGRRRLVQQFLAESLVLGLAGGLAGLVVAYWSTRALVALGPASIPRLSDVGIDWRVLAFAVSVAIVTSIVFGLAPALAATGDVSRLISAAGRSIAGHGGSRIRRTLVVCETALAVMLLVGAGLLIRSFQQISMVDPGFSTDHRLTFVVSLPEQSYTTSEAAGRFVREVVARLAGHAGVEEAAAVYGLPLDDNFSAHSSFTRAGEPDSPDTPSGGMRIITPGYFRAMTIALRSGRPFDPHDDEKSPEVVIINEEAARRYWPGQNPIGQQLHLSVRLAEARSGMKTIVGVVGDVKYGALDAVASPEVYVPHAQHPVDAMTMVVRTAGDPTAFVPIARADVASIDRDLPLAGVRTMDEVVGRSIAERRFTMLLLASFAVVAVLLAGIGVYGILAYAVSQRTQEIGVRLAIGAAPRDVVHLVLREGIVLTAVGLFAGIAGALAAARTLRMLLFGVTTTDPLTFASVAGTLALVALLASYVPARRAARVDPMTALRMD